MDHHQVQEASIATVATHVEASSIRHSKRRRKISKIRHNLMSPVWLVTLSTFLLLSTWQVTEALSSSTQKVRLDSPKIPKDGSLVWRTRPRLIATQKTRLFSSSASERSETTAAAAPSSSSLDYPQIHELSSRVRFLTQQQKYREAYDTLRLLVQHVQTAAQSAPNDDQEAFIHWQQRVGPRLDQAFPTFIATVLAVPPSVNSISPPGESRQSLILWGVQAIYWQLSLGKLDHCPLLQPYTTVPRRTFAQALQALTQWNEVAPTPRSMQADPAAAPDHDSDFMDQDISHLSFSTLAFRMLQRLITGVGVRPQMNGGTTTIPSTLTHSKYPTTTTRVYEKDINRVLNIYSNMGQMNICHRIVALQQRSPLTPPISPAGYSILFKGYGKLQNRRYLDLLLQHARHEAPNETNTTTTGSNAFVVDVVFMNTLMNAYIQCRAFDAAQQVFDQLRRGGAPNRHENEEELWFSPMPRPNQRSYNIVLKGLAQEQRQRSVLEEEEDVEIVMPNDTSPLQRALTLFSEMQEMNLWDAITINTLVQVALSASEFALAQQLLEDYTVAWEGDPSRRRQQQSPQQQHPNTEAYTQLLDCYAKSGQLTKALQVFSTMRERGVHPNQVTFTCLIAGLARHGKIQQAYQMMNIMNATATASAPTAITYNAFIAAVLQEPMKEEGGDFVTNSWSSSTASLYGAATDATSATGDETIPNEAIEEALKILRFMIRSGVKPNSITISTIVDALGRCHGSPRVQDAILLVNKLEKDKLMAAPLDARVITSLVRTCGLGNDIRNVILSFKRFKNNEKMGPEPDLIAVNVFLEACCRCNRGDLALETFRFYFEQPRDSRPSSQLLLQADVISYSTLICHLLSAEAIRKQSNRETAQSLYASMKKESVCPDKGLVDSILKNMLQLARNAAHSLPRADVLFVAAVLRDATRLEDCWDQGQMERRQRAVRAVLADRLQDVRREGVDEKLLSLGDKGSSFGKDGSSQDSTNDENDLFERKGWNQMDSGFRLWGAPGFAQSFLAQSEDDPSRSSEDGKVDEFLKSKGWNNVDSGFRII